MTTQERERDQEIRKKHPIFGTDFSKPVSVIIEDIRSQLSKARGQLSDIGSATGWGERVEHVEGLLTCGLVALHHTMEEIAKLEIRWDDEKLGESLQFSTRGIGLDACTGCFVCKATARSEKETNSYMSNISAFVKSKAEGEKIVEWFGFGAWLDFREHERDWIQIKIGACDNHIPQLESLSKKTTVHGIIRQVDILNAREMTQEG